MPLYVSYLLTVEINSEFLQLYRASEAVIEAAEAELELGDGFAKRSGFDAGAFHICPEPSPEQIARLAESFQATNQRILALVYSPGLCPEGFSSFTHAVSDIGLRAEVWDKR